jgi:hypothetical protein
VKLLRTPRAPVLVVRAGIDARRIHGVGEEVRAAVYWLLTRIGRPVWTPRACLGWLAGWLAAPAAVAAAAGRRAE